MEKRTLLRAACGVYRVKSAVYTRPERPESELDKKARQRREELEQQNRGKMSNEDAGRVFRFGLGALSTAGLLYWLYNRRKNAKTEVEDAVTTQEQYNE